MIQLTNLFCVLLIYNGTINIWLQYATDSIIRDPIKRRALYIKNGQNMPLKRHVCKCITNRGKVHIVILFYLEKNSQNFIFNAFNWAVCHKNIKIFWFTNEIFSRSRKVFNFNFKLICYKFGKNSNSQKCQKGINLLLHNKSWT